jgi:hypothetical protein
MRRCIAWKTPAGFVAGVTENKRRARVYPVTRAGPNYADGSPRASPFDLKLNLIVTDTLTGAVFRYRGVFSRELQWFRIPCQAAIPTASSNAMPNNSWKGPVASSNR